MDPLIQQHIDAVAEYLGKEPDLRRIASLSDTQWQDRFGRDNQLFGKTGAIFTKDRDIFLRGNGHESLLHELLHAAGLEEGSIGEGFNEGFTELVAREIAAEFDLQPTQSGYTELVNAVKNYVVPLTGMPLQEVARRYAREKDKAKFLSGLIARKYAHHFWNREDWGNSSDPRVLEGHLMGMFKNPLFNPFPYLEYLVDEVLPKTESFFHFLRK